ncbi:MAG: S8 family serine peptidase [Bacteroidota bacterium]|nr:S8 family serine peptidase [Rhodothermia bacterium]MCS7155514.1 S8 family serine peptidase [Bacteroidota bacterium]MDW8138387.1 S8 family serine peptidase [Bacteroidota bacterium]MDW8284676.1 S8 family serine peptidase [Bacteroidota bacterium]
MRGGLLLFCGLLGLCALPLETYAGGGPIRLGSYEPGLVVVRFREVWPRYRASVVSAGSWYVDELMRPYGLLGAEPAFPYSPEPAPEAQALNCIVLIRYAASVDPERVAARLRQLPEVLYAEPYPVYRVAFVPNDPRYGEPGQAYLRAIGAEEAWDVSRGDARITVAIVDTGVDLQHPDLRPNLWMNPREVPNNGIDDDRNGYVDDVYGWDFAGDDPNNPGRADNNPSAIQNAHGTHVAGLASAATHNGIGVASIGFSCRIMAVKVSVGAGPEAGLIRYGYHGIRYAADNGAQVINCSWGGEGYSQFGADVVAYARSRGALVVAAAGNSGTTQPFYPAAYEGVLAVAATVANPALSGFDQRASFSNYGFWVDVSAPGTSLLSTWIGGGYATSSGTSMASPVAAGLVALVLAARPELSPEQAGEQVRVTARDIGPQNPGFAYQLGYGRVDARRALSERRPAIRLLEYRLQEAIGNGDGIPNQGEELQLQLRLRNLLEPARGVRLRLEPLDGLTQPLRAELSVGDLATGSASQAEGLRLRVRSEAPNGSEAQLLLFIEDASGYRDWVALRFEITPTYRTLAMGLVEVTITGEGNIGFADFPDNFKGKGFRFLSRPDAPNVLFEGGLLLAVDSTRLVDVVRSGPNTAKRDFRMLLPVQILEAVYGADLYGRTEFDDAQASLRRQLRVRVRKEAFLWRSPPLDQGLLVRYEIANTGSDTLRGLRIGWFFDWDISPNGQTDSTGYDPEGRLLWVRGMVGSPTRDWFAVATDQAPAGAYLIDNAGARTPIGIYDGFSDGEKWRALSSGIATDRVWDTDVSHVLSLAPRTLAPGASTTALLILAAGRTLEEARAVVETIRARSRSLAPVGWPKDPERPVRTRIRALYPHPATHRVVLEGDAGQAGYYSWRLYDVLGRQLQVSPSWWLEPGRFRWEIPLEDLAPGWYWIRIFEGERPTDLRAVLKITPGGR